MGLFRLVPVGGITPANLDRVSGAIEANLSPAVPQASAAETASPPGPEMMTIRSPRCGGRREKPIRASTHSSNPVTGTAPVCRTTPSHISREPASAPVCEAAARLPSGVRPTFQTITGFLTDASYRALRNRGPSLIPSR